MRYYLMDAAMGEPVLALTFNDEGSAHEACVDFFGEGAWGRTVLLAAWPEDEDEDAWSVDALGNGQDRAQLEGERACG